MNRYSRISTSQFNPLNQQEIFTVPLARQRQHDQTQGQLDELGIFDINRLNQDDDTAKEFVSNYRNQIDAQVDSILKSGVDNKSIREVRGLLSQKNKWLSNDGEGGRIVNNYNSFQKYKGALDDSLKKGDIGNQRYSALLSQATSEYGGIRGEGQLNLEAAANRVDVSDKLRDYANDLRNNPDKLETNTGYKYDANSGMYINVKNGSTTTQSGLIDQVLQNIALTDPEITNYLGQRERLGLGSMQDTLSGITKSFEAGYSVNQREQDLTGKYMPEWMSNAGSNPDDINQSSFELAGAKELKLRNQKLSTNLGNILNGGFITERDGTVGDMDEFGFDNSNPVKIEATYDTLPENEKIEYDQLYDGLLQSDIIKSDDKSSPESIQAIQQYLNDHQDIDYQPIILTDGLHKTYDTRGSKIKKSTPNDLAQGIYLNGEKRVWYDPETNKVIKYKDLPSDDREALKKADVSGVYSSKNFLRDQIKDPINDRALTSPYEIKLPSGKKYLVGRSESELNSPAYKIDTKYNNIWRNISKYPDIPYKSELTGIGKVSITKMSDGRVIINKLKEDGSNSEQTHILNSDDALQHYMMLSNGINSKQ